MYTNYDSSHLNLNLYSRQYGGNCDSQCDTDCKQNCKNYCAMTKTNKTEQTDQLKRLQDMIKKLKADIQELAISRGGTRRRNRRRKRKGGFFAQGNKECEETCEKKCKSPCLVLCQETVESFLKEAQRLRDEIEYLTTSKQEIKTRRIENNREDETELDKKLARLRRERYLYVPSYDDAFTRRLRPYPKTESPPESTQSTPESTP